MNKQFKIITRKSLHKKFVRLFDRAYNINYKIFKRKPGNFKIIVCHTQQEFKKEAKYYYTKWGTATVLRNGNLIIKSPAISNKWKETDYPNIINHEMNHVFWTRLCNTTKPLWLTEGLACHIGKNFSNYNLKQLTKEHKINSTILHYRYIKKKLTGHIPFYPIWRGFTDYIIKRKGSHKVIILMDKYSKKTNKENYHKLFEHAFGSSEKELFEQFLNSIKR